MGPKPVWPPAANDFARAVILSARDTFEACGSLSPRVHALATRNPETGQRTEAVLLTSLLAGHPRWFASSLRSFAREVGALALVQVYEIRMVGALEDQASRGHEILGAHPEARDYVVIFLEDRGSATTLAWLANITADGSRLALGPFEEARVDRVEGWLTAVLDLVS